jgi:hypothetical protein
MILGVMTDNTITLGEMTLSITLLTTRSLCIMAQYNNTQQNDTWHVDILHYVTQHNDTQHIVAQHYYTIIITQYNRKLSVASLLNKCSCLARALGVANFTNMRDIILVTLCCAT